MGRKLYDDFTGKYSLSKTLRFELIPIGKTIENMINSQLIEKDEHRAQSYKKVKRKIDEYHKQYIDRRLRGFKLDGLNEFQCLYKINDKTEKEKELFLSCQYKLRKQIVSQLCSDAEYKRIFGKELITTDLYDIVDNEDERRAVEEFCHFTTVFTTGFYENRRNMYSVEEDNTAIAHRLINENLPKFIDNVEQFKKIVAIDEMARNILNIENDLKQILETSNLSDVFQLEYFNDTLTQKGIQKYNNIIGGYSDESGKKNKGINECVNEYNQTHKNKIGRLKMLYKQILSDRESISFIPEEISDDNEAIEIVRSTYAQVWENVSESDNKQGILSLFASMKEYDLNKIFIRNDTGLTEISQGCFGDWRVIQNALNAWYDQTHIIKKGKEEKYEEDRKRFLKSRDSYSVEFLQSICETQGFRESICGYLNECVRVLVNDLHVSYEKCQNLFGEPYRQEKRLSQEKADVEGIKMLLDAMKELQNFIKPLMGKGNEPEKDERFYGELNRIWENITPLNVAYNRVRNYMTKKPYSTEKIKLNFENPTLLSGWDLNKEEANLSVIFRKDGQFYLGIIDSKHRQVFRQGNVPVTQDTSCYEKLEYKLLPGPNKMFPKVFFSKSRLNEFAPNAEILRIYNEETYKKGTNFNLEDCHKLIDFFKQSIEKNKDWSKFGFKFSDTKTYEDISGFYREVEQQGYMVNFVDVPESYVDSLVEEGKLYLFHIYNKDFSSYSKGKPNLHTMYWKALFTEENMKCPVYKLNGKAEIFYRKASISKDNQVVHPANEPIRNKNINNEKQKSLFAYDIVKDKRYTVDKFQFHVPITLNFVSENKEHINEDVNKAIKNTDDIYVIGIDRGERNLLYLTVVNEKGEIVEQCSFNNIVNEYNGRSYRTDYHELLDRKEKERTKEREEWKTIENIKELKEGYLSQVIHKITQLMVKYNAIVVLEDLNTGFMKGRQKVEKQIYQKFEKMLIDKLNYFIDKGETADNNGGLMKAYQLTNKFESFKKMGKQSGVLFYVPAWNTSKIDPTTGFVDLLHPKYENIESSKDFFSKFDDIRYYQTQDEEYFEFNTDYSKFTYKADGTRTDWNICTFGERIINVQDKKGIWSSKKITLNEEFKKLFNEFGVDYTRELKEQIVGQSEKKFFERLTYLLKITLQIRNSITGTEVDYLLSPVKGKNGEFFDSRNCGEGMPKNADANGAYNIARKGLMLVEQIKNTDTDKMKKVKLTITNKEWLQYAQRQV